MDRFTSIFERVAQILETLDIDYLVVGSIAATVWGLRRTTVDIDLAVHVPNERFSELTDSLSANGLYVPVDAARTALATSGSFNIIDTASSGKVDIFACAPTDSFERMRLTRRVAADLFGISTWVATAEDIVLAKLRWRAESNSDVQWRDCVEIAAINDLDLQHMRTWAETLGVSEDLDRLLSP